MQCGACSEHCPDARDHLDNKNNNRDDMMRLLRTRPPAPSPLRCSFRFFRGFVSKEKQYYEQVRHQAAVAVQRRTPDVIEHPGEHHGEAGARAFRRVREGRRGVEPMARNGRPSAGIGLRHVAQPPPRSSKDRVNVAAASAASRSHCDRRAIARKPIGTSMAIATRQLRARRDDADRFAPRCRFPHAAERELSAAGLKCAPEIRFPNGDDHSRISPSDHVAQERRSPDCRPRRSAMIPEPTTVATRCRAKAFGDQAPGACSSLIAAEAGCCCVLSVAITWLPSRRSR